MYIYKHTYIHIYIYLNLSGLLSGARATPRKSGHAIHARLVSRQAEPDPKAPACDLFDIVPRRPGRLRPATASSVSICAFVPAAASVFVLLYYLLAPAVAALSRSASNPALAVLSLSSSNASSSAIFRCRCLSSESATLAGSSACATQKSCASSRRECPSRTSIAPVRPPPSSTCRTRSSFPWPSAPSDSNSGKSGCERVETATPLCVSHRPLL